MNTPKPIEPFVVKHYIDDVAPSLKGNGFDGLTIGNADDERAWADEFVAWINARIVPPAPQHPQWYGVLLLPDGELQLYGPFSEPEYAESWILNSGNDGRKSWVVTRQSP